MKSHVRFARVRDALRRFHADETGNETVQTVMILAFGCLIMTGLYYLWKEAAVGDGGGGILGAIESIIGELLGNEYTG